MITIYNLLRTFLGESKQGYYSEDIEQYQFDCCCCAEENGGIPDGKHNLEILLSYKRGLKFHCWKCGDTNHMRGSLDKLIKQYGGPTIYKEYREILNSLIKSKLYDINLYDGENNNLIDEENKIFLPQTYTNIDLSTIKNKALKDFLEKRGFTQEIIDRYKIGYTQWDDEDWTMRKKIIIPSYNQFNELNFFVARDYTNKAKIKYKNCNADKKKIIFQESLINWNDDVFLCEGAIDCLTIPNAISLLGKSLDKNSELYNALLTKSKGKIVICLDGDTDIEETKKIYSMLNFGRLKNRIWYVRLGENNIPYKDFNDIFVSNGKYGMVKMLKQMKQFEEIDLIW